MSRPGSRSFPLGKVAIAFLSVMALLIVTLGWLGWLLMDQDRSLADQRARERLDAAVAELEKKFSDRISAERSRLDEIVEKIGSVPDVDAPTVIAALRGPLTVIQFSQRGNVVVPETDLLYVPILKPAQILPDEFARTDRLEFQHEDLPSAIRLLTALADSPDRHSQASALMRLGRISRREGRMGESLSYYERLAEFDGQRVGAVPADWLALYARCSIFEATERLEELRVETARLSRLLASGGRPVSRTTYRHYSDAAARWSSLVGPPARLADLAQSKALSEMAGELFGVWADTRSRGTNSSGVVFGGTDTTRVLGLWVAVGSDLLTAMLPADELLDASLTVVTDRLESQGIGWRVSDSAGKVIVSGLDNGEGTPSIRALVLGGTSFTVSALDTPDMAPAPGDVSRRRLLWTGLLLVLTMILASSYFISRILRREAEIAGLQSDFVAAVSHEFRSPLTSIRQLTELLASGRIESQEKAEGYYRVLDREAMRLQRLVEGLLDFGRMEAGAHPYHLEMLDCRALLEEIVDAFREEYSLTPKALALEVEGRPNVRMDRESLTRAIWNLLDNAVKYSSESVEVEVKGLPKDGKFHISIADRGVGFPPEEQHRIFDKFVRGSAAQVTNAKGTGMGLAMVREIIESQGGEVHAHGNPGRGAVFTIMLEAPESS